MKQEVEYDGVKRTRDTGSLNFTPDTGAIEEADKLGIVKEMRRAGWEWNEDDGIENATDPQHIGSSVYYFL